MTYQHRHSRQFLRSFSLFSFLTVCMVIVLSGCQQGATTSAGSNQKPIVIGASLPLTGDRAPDGQALLRGYQLWQAQVNQHGGLLGRQVNLDIVNDNSNANQVVTDYQTIITAHHDDLIFAPFSSVLTLAGAPIAHRYHYAYLAGTGGIDSIFNFGFPEYVNVSLPIRSYLNTFDDWILSLPGQQRPHTVAYIGEDNPFSTLQLAAAKKQLEAGGLKTSLYQIYPEESTDYTPLAQKVIQSNADVVVLGTHVNDCVAFIKAFKQQHYNPKALIATGGPDGGASFTGPVGGPQVAEGVFVPNGGWYPDIKTYQNDQFVQSYLAKYPKESKIDINSGTAQGYAVGQVLEQAVKQTNSIDNQKIITALHTNTFNSLQGPVKFDKTGANVVSVAYLFQWQKSQPVVVYPTSYAQVNPEFPKQVWP